MNFYSNMVRSNRVCFNCWGKNKYIAPIISKAVCNEHERRMRIQIDLNSLPDSWDKYLALTDAEQRNTAHLLSIAVKLFDHPRSEFVQGVLQECEWILADFWEYTCEGCGLPYSFCKVPAIACTD